MEHEWEQWAPSLLPTAILEPFIEGDLIDTQSPAGATTVYTQTHTNKQPIYKNNVSDVCICCSTDNKHWWPQSQRKHTHTHTMCVSWWKPTKDTHVCVWTSCITNSRNWHESKKRRNPQNPKPQAAVDKLYTKKHSLVFVCMNIYLCIYIYSDVFWNIITKVLKGGLLGWQTKQWAELLC